MQGTDRSWSAITRLGIALFGATSLIALNHAKAAPPIEEKIAVHVAMPLIELRQYKIVSGQRDRFIALFEREFIETQEALGMQLVGQFRDLDDPNRFVWIRAFKDMPSRGEALQTFYFGPVWQAHRNEANPMLDDNDNVLLLHAAGHGAGFAFDKNPLPPRGAPSVPGGLVIANIDYLWKAPDDGFVDLFERKLKPAFEAAGIPVLAYFVPESARNNFPRLPVRQGEKVFVWFTRFDSTAAYEASLETLKNSAAWRAGLGAEFSDKLERTPQILRLEPTARSRLR